MPQFFWLLGRDFTCVMISSSSIGQLTILSFMAAILVGLSSRILIKINSFTINCFSMLDNFRHSGISPYSSPFFAQIGGISPFSKYNLHEWHRKNFPKTFKELSWLFLIFWLLRDSFSSNGLATVRYFLKVEFLFNRIPSLFVGLSILTPLLKRVLLQQLHIKIGPNLHTVLKILSLSLDDVCSFSLVFWCFTFLSLELYSFWCFSFRFLGSYSFFCFLGSYFSFCFLDEEENHGLGEPLFALAIVVNSFLGARKRTMG